MLRNYIHVLSSDLVVAVFCNGFCGNSDADQVCLHSFDNVPGFMQTLESPEIKMLRFPGLESPGKGIGPRKPWRSPGISGPGNVASGSSIAP